MKRVRAPSFFSYSPKIRRIKVKDQRFETSNFRSRLKGGWKEKILIHRDGVDFRRSIRTDRNTVVKVLENCSRKMRNVRWKMGVKWLCTFVIGDRSSFALLIYDRSAGRLSSLRKRLNGKY